MPTLFDRVRGPMARLEALLARVAQTATGTATDGVTLGEPLPPAMQAATSASAEQLLHLDVALTGENRAATIQLIATELGLQVNLVKPARGTRGATDDELDLAASRVVELVLRAASHDPELQVVLREP